MRIAVWMVLIELLEDLLTEMFHGLTCGGILQCEYPSAVEMAHTMIERISESIPLENRDHD